MKKVVALITGGNRGIGASCVEEFAKSGVNVIINYCHHKEEAEKFASYIEETYQVEALAIKCDVSDSEEVEQMVICFNKEIESSKAKLASTKDEQTRERLEKYIETLTEASYKIKNYYNDLFDGNEDHPDPDGKVSLLLDYTDSPRDVADPWWTGDFNATERDVINGINGFYNFLKDNKMIK